MNPDSNATSSASLWYFTQNDTVHGPVPFPELVRLKSGGEITADTLVVEQGREGWIPLSEILSLEVNTGGRTDAPSTKGSTLTPKQEARSQAVFGCFILFLISFGLLFLLSHCFFSGADNEGTQETQLAIVHKLMKRVYGSELRETSATEISGSSGPANGKLNVYVKVNASLRYSASSNKFTMDENMAKAFKALYTSGLPIWEVTIWNYGDLIDRYGNESSDVVYKVSLHSQEGSKINWKNANFLTLEELWNVNYAHPVMRE